MEGPAEEVAARAIPFQEGEEVLVTIVEPHMYNADDAVAKIDGYVVSVAGGGPHIGEKRMVRIEEAGRNSARATMLDAPGSGDGLESESRSTGRSRSGRRAAEPAAAGSETKTD